jgi:sugar lactone lactonase YvrE
VTRINERGQTQVLTGLPSVGGEGTGDFAIGPSDIGFEGSGSSFVTIGLGADPALRTQIPALDDMGQILRTRIFKNEWKLLADLGDFEAANDPNEDGPDTNPNSVLALSDRRIVADAGANALLRVKNGGKVSVIATFPNISVPGAPPEGMDAVPTSVAKGPDGAFYVGQLTGFPFPIGGATVFRVERGEDPEIFAEGFTNIIDIAFDKDGTLYVLEIFHNSLLSGDPTGALIRVDDNGNQEIVMSDGLITPGGLAIKGDYAYVSNCGTCAGVGEVLRIPID